MQSYTFERSSGTPRPRERHVKFLSHIAPRAGAEDACSEQVALLVEQLLDHTAGETLTIESLVRLPDDVFGARAPYGATLDFRGDAVTPDRLAELLEGLGDRLHDVAHPDLSTALLGEDVVFIEPESSTGVRYQYLMRRNASYSHSAYLKRYREIHSKFGLRIPGIKGYVQFHVDPAASRRVARAAGLGTSGFDSVSELYLESLDTFLAAVSTSTVGPEAIADEEVFVDRGNSHDFCSRLAAG